MLIVITDSCRVRLRASFVFFWLASFFASSASQAVEISGVLPGALDIPRINVVLKPSPDGAPLRSNFGVGVEAETINIQAFFDTGASGLLMSDETAVALGVQRATSGGQPVKYSDIGVGGSQTFDVSVPYYVGVGNFHDAADAENPAYYSQKYGQMKVHIAAPTDDVNLKGLDVFGMPLFAGKVVVIDPRPTDLLDADGNFKFDFSGDLTDLGDIGTMRTFVYDPGKPFNPATVKTDPGIPAVAHHIQLSYASFDRFTTVTPAGNDAPTLAHNPFIGPNPVAALEANPAADSTPPVTFGFGDKTTTGSFLLDTGAAASMISTAKAAELAIRYKPLTLGSTPILETFNPSDPSAPGTAIVDQFTLTVAGVGGTKTIAGFYLESLTLPTMEGSLDPNDPAHIHYRGAPVLVNDISVLDPLTGQSLTLDGLIGMNMFAGSYASGSMTDINDLFSNLSNGAFDWIVFDESNGTLGLALKGEVVAVPEPAICGTILLLGCMAIARYRNRARHT